MKHALIVLALVGVLAGCGAATNATHPALPVAPPTPRSSATPAPVDLLIFKMTPYALGPWPDAGGPFVVMSFGDGPRDSTGVRVFVANGKAYQHPVVQAQDGLAALVRYTAHRDAADLRLAIKEATRLVSYHTTNAATGDAWWYPYLFNFEEYNEIQYTAVAPWYSGMAQGEALDLFTQLAVWTKDPRWVTAAAHTFTSFLYPLMAGESVTARPWVARLDDQGYYWIEEYPTPNASDNTINGSGFATFGLIDYARLSGDARAKRLADAGLTTFLYGASLVRHPGHISSYSVSHPKRLYPGYHVVVTSELSLFGAVTGDAQFTTLSQAFYQDYH